MVYSYQKPNELDFRGIVLSHLKRILEIGSHELRSSERILILDDARQIIESEDTRISFCQSVELLAYTLQPYFDEEMQKLFDANIIFLEGFGYEIELAIKDKEFNERISKKEGQEKNNMIIYWQVRSAKKMFSSLNALLKRQEYLKSNVYGEGEEIEMEGGDS